MKFCKAVIEFERTVVESALETPENAPATLAPSHSVADIPTIPVPTNPVVVPTPVVATPAKLAKPALKGVLKNSSKGEQVKYLQQQLGLPIDGTFDGKTHAAVVAFQKKKKLAADGIVGPITWKAIG
jgi:peptidoglycan hydrolase-like protein with peptidoglycan-binding domain